MEIVEKELLLLPKHTLQFKLENKKLVRKNIAYLQRKKTGGTMPEDLPTPEKSLKQLEKEKTISLSEKQK